MKLRGRLGLRARLAIAFVAVALLAVGLATLLSNRGLHPRVSAAAEARLERSALHLARAGSTLYDERGRWTPTALTTLEHLASLDGFAVRLETPERRVLLRGRPDGRPTASARVYSGGRLVASVEIMPLSGRLLTPEEEHLQRSMNRLHLIAGAVSAAAALVIAVLLASTLSRSLRRIRQAATHIEQGDLSTRVVLGGDPEVRAVGHALNRLAETLEHEEEVRKQTVADLAHELRTPIGGLLSRIEAAQDGVLTDERANIAAMHDETLRLSRLLDDLGRLAEAEQPGLLLEKRAVRLDEIARSEADVFAERFAARGIRFEAELEPVRVSGDAGRLRQIASNLLSNALRYTEPGGEVRLRVAAERDLAVLEVTDTGIGIPPEDLAHIFKRFWRGEKSRSRATGGAGIGLAIVSELVRAHDGRIDVESAPGRGSRFRVVLRSAGEGVHNIAKSRSRDLQIAPPRWRRPHSIEKEEEP